MPKEVLVICSSPGGMNYPRQENKRMLETLLGADYVPTFLTTQDGFQGSYPTNLPKDHHFDAVLFAGCNVLQWLFKHDYESGMQALSSILRNDGIIIFVENKNYVTKFGGPEHYGQHSLTISLNKMTVFPTVLNDKTGVKDQMLNTWNKYFTLMQIGDYIVYRKNSTSGGRRKWKSANTKRKRSSKSRQQRKYSIR
jgi:hypothetical protein